MDEIYPGVYILEKDTEYNYESDATYVENIMNEIMSLKGEGLSNAQYEFEYLLKKLLNYVTLIGFDIMQETCEMEPMFVYFYDLDVVEILRLQLMADNSWGQMKDISEYLNQIEEYKSSCINKGKCVVYDMEDTGEKIRYNLIINMSDLRRL